MTALPVHKRIRAARQARGWSQRELGRRLAEPVSHVTVGNVERGVQYLTLDLVVDYARALDVPVRWLLEPILD